MYHIVDQKRDHPQKRWYCVHLVVNIIIETKIVFMRHLFVVTGSKISEKNRRIDIVPVYTDHCTIVVWPLYLCILTINILLIYWPQPVYSDPSTCVYWPQTLYLCILNTWVIIIFQTMSAIWQQTKALEQERVAVVVDAYTKYLSILETSEPFRYIPGPQHIFI